MQLSSPNYCIQFLQCHAISPRQYDALEPPATNFAIHQRPASRLGLWEDFRDGMRRSSLSFECMCRNGSEFRCADEGDFDESTQRTLFPERSLRTPFATRQYEHAEVDCAECEGRKRGADVMCASIMGVHKGPERNRTVKWEDELVSARDRPANVRHCQHRTSRRLSDPLVTAYSPLPRVPPAERQTAFHFPDISRANCSYQSLRAQANREGARASLRPQFCNGVPMTPYLLSTVFKNFLRG